MTDNRRAESERDTAQVQELMQKLAQLEKALLVQSARLDRAETAIKDAKQREDRLLSGPVFRTLNRIQAVARSFNRGLRSGYRSLSQRWSERGLRARAKPVEAAQPPQPSHAGAPLLPVEDLPWPVQVDRKLRMERNRTLVVGQPPIPSEPLITVILTTRDSALYIRDILQSVLQQTYSRFELLVVDDASRDNTCALVEECIAADPRVRLIRLNSNRGIYWGWNAAISEARGEVIALLPDRQVCLPSYLDEHLKALRKRGVAASLSYGEPAPESASSATPGLGLAPDVAPASLMLKRHVFDEIGYFDTVKALAEAEMRDRVQLAYGAASVQSVTGHMCRTIPGSGNSNLKTSAEKSAHYIRSYQAWHRAVSDARSQPYVPFPVTNRSFAPHEDLLVEGKRFLAEPIVAFMATFPKRRKHLARAVQSLLPQVDHLYIYMNNYEEIPEFLLNERITALPASHLEDLRDIGKFYHMPDVPTGYFFTVDDDIEYPDNYCDTLVRKIEDYDRKAIVGVHGVIFEQPLQRFFSPNRTTFRFQRALDVDAKVNLIGTGTMAFHSSTIAFEPGSLPKGMADIGVAIAAKVNRVDMIAIARPEKWLTPILVRGQEDQSLWEEFRENDDEHTEILKQHGDWRL
ncbi:glycosyltransferase family 2 protein [Microvirga mediterraneensis]|uniref:Glycosyltransferase family 2 protein n=1 Tax=Microvirga mediterraneensis TaxID=2754695 RepID=A0A838BS65_9HYPH|nr:glycosyltransferase family A protein [Microvirga mediterraneensis]MBA1158170.1 glycosyltransferase family 2 protein [Microvirga mediterraneensis]